MTNHYSLYDRSCQLYQVIARLNELHIDATVTRVAKSAGMKPSTHLTKLLLEMARDGHLEIVEFPYRAGIVARRFVAVMATSVQNYYHWSLEDDLPF